MKQMLILEFKNCINRKEFKFIFSFLMFMAIGAFLFTASSFYGFQLSFVRSAYESSMIQGIYSQFILSAEIILLPLLASIIYSDSFYADSKSGVYKSILARTDKKTYLIAKAIVIFAVTFLVFLIPLLINQLLSFTAFPLVGFDNNYSLPSYDIGIQNYSGQGWLFEVLRLQSPFLFNVVGMLKISLFAALFALLTYSVYFVYKKGKLAGIAGVFFLYIVLSIAFDFIGLRQYGIINYLYMPTQGTPAMMVFWILALLSASLLMINRGLKNEIEIE